MRTYTKAVLIGLFLLPAASAISNQVPQLSPQEAKAVCGHVVRQFMFHVYTMGQAGTPLEGVDAGSNSPETDKAFLELGKAVIAKDYEQASKLADKAYDHCIQDLTKKISL